MKKCCTCKEEKDLAAFGLRKVGGLPVAECKSCVAKRSNRWYWENRKRSLDQRKKYYQDHREESLKKWKKRYERDKETILKRQREFGKRPEQRRKANIRQKEWFKKNPDRRKRYGREWSQRNPEKKLAHQYVLWALRLNVIQKPSECQRCGMQKRLDGHHKDYSKPLEVVWLCKICHELEHHEEEDDSASRHNIELHSSEGEEANG